MKSIYLLILKDFTRFKNDKRAMLLTFIVPMVLIIIFGSIFGNGNDGMGRMNLILLDESNTPFSRLIVSKLESSKGLRLWKKHQSENSKDSIKFDEMTAREWVMNGKISAALIIPADNFTDTSKAIKFNFLFDPKNDIESSIIQGNIKQVLFSQISHIIPILLQRQISGHYHNNQGEKYFRGISKLTEEYLHLSADSLYNRMTTLDTASLNGLPRIQAMSINSFQGL